MKAETVDDLDTPIRRGVRSVAETGCKKPEGVPASVWELGDLCAPMAPLVPDDAVLRRDVAAAVCRSLARKHGITAGELA